MHNNINNNQKNDSIIIIGTGCVATVLIKNFISKGLNVIQQYGRTAPKDCSIPFISDINQLKPNADFYIVAVSDDSISEIASQLPKVNGVVAHTAGSVDIDVFSKCNHYGVLYPLQSYSPNRNIEMESVPFLIEGNSSYSELLLKQLAEKISNTVTIMPFNNRLHVHLAAVFASNFSNHMNTIAQELLLEKNIDFTLLKPLLQETFAKILSSNPKEAQTGPAKRGDLKILEKHKEMLTSNPNFQEIYITVSKSIADFHNDPKDVGI